MQPRHWVVWSVFVAVQAAFAGTIIDTTGSDTGTIFNYGSENTATYGQTFTVGADDILDSFSLYLRARFAGAGPLDLKGYIGAWDGTKVSSVLFTGGTQTMNAAGDLQEFAWNTGGLALNTGDSYVAFLSISEIGLQPTSQFGMPNGVDSIPGQFVFQNNGLDFGALQTSSWTLGWIGEGDVWFKASFSATAVPEPGTMALLGLGLLAVRRRRRA